MENVGRETSDTNVRALRNVLHCIVIVNVDLNKREENCRA